MSEHLLALRAPVLISGINMTPVGDAAAAEELRKAINPKLRHDEQIVWAGRPDPAQFHREMWRGYVMFLLPLAGAAAGMVTSVRIGERLGAAPNVPMLVVLGFVALAVCI